MSCYAPTTRLCMLLSCTGIRRSRMACTKSSSCRTRPSRTASPSRSWAHSSSSASGRIGSRLRRGEGHDHSLGQPLQRVMAAFAPRLALAGGMAQPAARISACPVQKPRGHFAISRLRKPNLFGKVRGCRRSCAGTGSRSEFSRDRVPAHVHGFKAGDDAKVDIAGAAPVLVTTTMSKRDTASLLALVAANLPYLQAEWSRVHGPLC